MTIEIKQIRLTPLYVPFKDQVRQIMASGERGVGMAIPIDEIWLGGDFAVCQLVCDDGTIGLGEVFVWMPETGVSPAQIIEVIKGSLAKYVLGESPFNVERIRWKMNRNVTRNEVAKGLLDMACYDLMGKITNRPAYDFMGGRSVDEIPLAALVPLMNPETMVAIAKMYYEQGFGTIRVKLGKGISQDVGIIERIRRTIGSAIRLRVDYNQAYQPPEAVRAIKAIEPFNIDFVEQPVRADDYMGMAYVQQRVDTPLMAHEGCFSLQDLVTLVDLQAIGVVGINSERPGGVTSALKALDFAERMGMPAVLHDQPLGISSAMHIHLAAARHDSLGHATELTGDLMLEDDLIVNPLDYIGGAAKVPEGPGWGVQLDDRALEKYRTAPTTILEK
nr:mandelate racemase/muconate lactonizing enzyme family protein [Candidatus Njordarchaeota archaeon]